MEKFQADWMLALYVGMAFSKPQEDGINPPDKISFRDGALVFAGGGGGGGDRDFLEAGNFFHNRLSTCNFFPPTDCTDNSLKFPKARITRVVSADNFFRNTSGADNLFQQFFSCR